RIAVGSLSLQGATLALRADAGAPIPLIGRSFWPVPSRAGARATAVHGRADPSARWSWMVERFETISGRVRVASAAGSFDLPGQASGENLGTEAYWSPLRIAI